MSPPYPLKKAGILSSKETGAPLPGVSALLSGKKKKIATYNTCLHFRVHVGHQAPSVPPIPVKNQRVTKLAKRATHDRG